MVLGFSAKEEHVGKLEVSLFTLVLISWALKEEHSETPEQQAGQIYKSFVAPCILSVPFLHFQARNLVLRLTQGPIGHRMALLTGHSHTWPATLAKQGDGRS